VLTEKQLQMWADEESLKDHLRKQCLKEHLRPADLVGPALFLASDASRMMTGQALVVDGGVVVTG
jgi:NAD(P)-dependent dehydrogenase (short-subunit alcohol dehydrogenase family)